MRNKKIVIAGGTGFIGKGLCAYFGTDNDVVVLTRHPAAAEGRVQYIYWDGRTLGGWEGYLDGADLLINLTGKSVNCRYTAANRQEIFDSRTQATAILGEAVRLCGQAPRVWINAGSATIYRHAEDRAMDEYNGEIEDDFSVQVCKRWEGTFNALVLPGTRKIILRIAVTLGAQGGVIFPYLNLVKFGLGGYQGTGRQMYSWVHITDICRMMEWLYERDDQEGTYNCSAPQPVTNRVFMQTLRKATGYWFGLPAPTWILRIGAKLIGTETELLLKSRWVLPTRITQAGFRFRYPQLRGAMDAIVAELPRRRYWLV
ncbi:TIGR01777 family oxidoreductase [Chitinophaga pendula]|uniref:TIGR01777 family oxidoreductase n=1 Tax=Chitinophaga TaxID=79328 RepID=UPI000BB0C2BF|nr:MULTISPECIES: TIGR01777 family oxidoreductase [Chitinophaga]ASZ09548.1 TIGR01777 family protein [Chitinophaga sp. MD30]UCJ07517.1 TIGR01777 family oxidoreductase [Chitinophaga pendula]